MPSNEELYEQSDCLPAFSDEYTSDDIEVAHQIVERFREQHLATFGPVNDEWLESIGRGEFTHEGFYFCVAFNSRELGVPYLIWRPEHSNGDHWESWPFPLKTRAIYLQLLTALGITTAAGEGK